MRTALVLVAVAAVAAMTALAGSPAIAGKYLETRSNEVYTCACLYSGERYLSGQEAILAWQIDQGDVDGVSLAGTEVVAVVVGDRNLDFTDTHRKSLLFVDSPAADAERHVVNLFSRLYRNVLGEITGVRRTPIEFVVEGDRATVHVENLTVELRKAVLPADAHPGSYRWYEPFVRLSHPELAVTLTNEFWGQEFDRRWRVTYPHISGYFGTFVAEAND